MEAKVQAWAALSVEPFVCVTSWQRVSWQKYGTYIFKRKILMYFINSQYITIAGKSVTVGNVIWRKR